MATSAGLFLVGSDQVIIASIGGQDSMTDGMFFADANALRIVEFWHMACRFDANSIVACKDNVFKTLHIHLYSTNTSISGDNPSDFKKGYCL